jgi:hypothetical protein
MRLKNVSGHAISQQFEGKRYDWDEDGDVMTLPDGLGAWMLSKLNNADANPALKAERAAIGDAKKAAEYTWLKMLAPKHGEQSSDQGIIKAEKGAKKFGDVPPKGDPEKVASSVDQGYGSAKK